VRANRVELIKSDIGQTKRLFLMGWESCPFQLPKRANRVVVRNLDKRRGNLRQSRLHCAQRPPDTREQLVKIVGSFRAQSGLV
jgi:hypothetical protein